MEIVTLSDAATRHLAPMAAVIERVRSAVIAARSDAFRLPQRHVFGVGEAVVMPVFHEPTRSIVVKTLTLSENRDPLIEGIVTWADADSTGAIVADARSLTAIRTGAIVGVAVDLMADQSASRLTVIGIGAQSADQVRAVFAVRSVRTVTIVGRDMARTRAATDALQAEFPQATFHPSTDIRASILDAQIVCCATSAHEPLFTSEDLPADVMVSAIGSFTPAMHELPIDLFSDATAVVVDDVDACRAEAGEIIAALEHGSLSIDRLLPLGDAVSTFVPHTGRRIFKSVGIAAQDWAAMAVIRENLAAEGSVALVDTERALPR